MLQAVFQKFTVIYNQGCNKRAFGFDKLKDEKDLSTKSIIVTWDNFEDIERQYHLISSGQLNCSSIKKNEKGKFVTWETSGFFSFTKCCSQWKNPDMSFTIQIEDIVWPESSYDLNFIFTKFPADLAMQYFKERGLNIINYK